MENYTNAFLDVISNINNLGKERGFKNGLDMAEKGLEKGILTQSEFNDYKNLHNFRNGGGHGFSRDLSIRRSTFNFAKTLYSKLKRSNLYSSNLSNAVSRHEQRQNKKSRDHIVKPDYSYINDYYESRGEGIPRESVKKIKLDNNEIGDCSARLDNNKLEVTVESCERTMFGYIFTLLIVDAYSELVYINLRNGGDIYYERTVEVVSKRKKTVVAKFKHWPLKEIEIGLNGHYTRYSIKLNKMI
ncbi:MAG: hypothetical protein SPK49_04910 [Erysipelotrichaceae bacterium]|nr:hypothetical protein [Erysipelotrichaceae bacterium]